MRQFVDCTGRTWYCLAFVWWLLSNIHVWINSCWIYKAVEHSLNKAIGKISTSHDDVIKWKHFPRYWPFVWGIHRSPVNSPHKGQWRRALMFPLICVGINGWVNNRKAGDLRRYRAHYDVIVMKHHIVIPHTCSHWSSLQYIRQCPIFISPIDRSHKSHNASNIPSCTIL